MKERPILFSAPMVRALLAGTKTQTRRVFRLPRGCSWYASLGGEAAGWLQDDTGPAWWHVDEQRCPYGAPGDRLWVREAHAFSVVDPEGYGWRDDPENWDVIYRADEKQPAGGWRDNDGNVILPPWRPSIHMPRWASRILLDVTSARVERLQDISEADAMAEGIVRQRDGGYGLPAGEHYHAHSARISYWSLWDAINGAGSVDANPWVWVVAFSAQGSAS